MATVLWGHRGVLLVDMSSRGDVTSECYCGTFERSLHAAGRRMPRPLRPGVIILAGDATPQTASCTRSALGTTVRLETTPSQQSLSCGQSFPPVWFH